MIAKELRDTWWVLVISTVLILLPAFSVTSYEQEINELSGQAFTSVTVNSDGSGTGSPASSPDSVSFQMSETPAEYALSEMWFPYAVSYPWLMTFSAAILGFSLISKEVSRGTIFLLLARPVSRTRMLLTKYGACAGALLVVVTLGALGLVISAGLNEYPLGVMSAVGLVLSTALVWLGSLLVLGLATLISVVFKDVIAGAVATPLSLVLVLFVPGLFVSYLVQYWDRFLEVENPGQAGEQFILPLYWADRSLFAGESLAATNFFVCAIAAVVPLLVALWIFNRKAY